MLKEHKPCLNHVLSYVKDVDSICCYFNCQMYSNWQYEHKQIRLLFVIIYHLPTKHELVGAELQTAAALSLGVTLAYLSPNMLYFHL